ncbi:hypothetical protein [Paenibacillus monticola]|uniref:Uncharacterized protein n=1 Tax=Paenibacillus monticola TaxID=2666075 RepID=A0A7X2L1Y5_9BACL|nr:hypothetical protein [Paenibacillus monticola]MRN52746.1 hypothetical protein [Paenibacillus monticola]
MDLRNDWHNFLKSQFKAYPFLKKEDYNGLSLDEVSLVYFNWSRLFIQPVKRNVHYSKEFKCPKAIKKRLEKVVQKIQLGQNLIPHQTRSLKNLYFKDPLYFDWGIQHLHLGDTIEADGFVKREKTNALNDYLLYAFFTEQDAFLVQIMDHASFNKQELAKIIHRNWPETIECYKINGFSPSAPIITDKDINYFRKSGASIFIELDDNAVYGPMGGGISTNRTSVNAIYQNDYFHFRIDKIKQEISNNIFNYANHVRETVGHLPTEMEFILNIDIKNNFSVYEKNSNINFRFEGF